MTTNTNSRIAELREKLKAAEKQKGPTFDVPFRAKTISLRRVRVKATFPLYRIQSGRTRLAQSAYLDEHPEIPKDFFQDPEDPKVQQTQHQILLRLIAEKDLNKDLEDRGQREPLVLTKDGFVVDGNRRLASLREEEKDYVEAVVLPEDAEAAEIYETELELQMQKETKAPYNWIDQALHINYGIKDLREDIKTVAARMRLSEQEVKDEIEKLELVRSYLEWLGEPGKYHKVPSDSTGSMKEAFGHLAQRLTSREMLRRPAAERRTIRNAVFLAISQEAGYMQVRSIVKQMSQKSTKIVERLRKKKVISTKSTKKKPAASAPKAKRRVTDSTDPLRALVDDTDTTVEDDLEDLHLLVADAANAKDVGPALMEAIEELEEEEKETKRQQRPLERIRAAVASLEKVDLDSATEGLAEIAREISRVFEEAERLRKSIEKIRGQEDSR
jgi:hypothetical protein